MSGEVQNPGFDQLSRDHRALRDSFMDLSNKMVEGLAAVDGKVDRSLVLLEKVNQRQDRSEERVDRVEGEVSSLRDKLETQREADNLRHERARRDDADRHSAELRALSSKTEAITMRVWIGVGAVMAITTAIPIVLKFIGAP